MESSASEECDCYMCRVGMSCQCQYIDQIPYYSNPFYSTMGQPLVYFANVKSHCGKKPSRFVRAFRWYTEIHNAVECAGPSPSTGPNYLQSSQMGGFANWLDAQYDQYLQENGGGGSCCVKVTQANIIETCEPAGCITERKSETCTRRRFGRFRRRSRSRGNESSKEPSKQSMEYILAPKDLSRAASDTCQATQQSCSSVVKKPAVKSQSLTSVCEAKVPCQECNEPVKIDKPPVEEKPQPAPKVEKKLLAKKRPKMKSSKKNVSCQCFAVVPTKTVETQYDDKPEETVLVKTSKTKQNQDCQCPVPKKVDVQSQYQPCPARRRDICVECACADCGGKPQDNENKYYSTVCVNENRGPVPAHPLSQQNIIINTGPAAVAPPVAQRPCSICCPVSNTCKTDCQSVCVQTEPCINSYTHDAAQTSDFAISFDTQTIRQCPVFMKIICVEENQQARLYTTKATS